MEFRVILRLAVPLLAVLFGFIIRKSEKEQYKPFKKYWIVFIIGGILIFLYRYNKYLG